jgi:hypothetical protein
MREHSHSPSQVIFITCMPACLMKQAVNIAQLLSASHVIAAEDAKNRNQDKVD